VEKLESARKIAIALLCCVRLFWAQKEKRKTKNKSADCSCKLKQNYNKQQAEAAHNAKTARDCAFPAGKSTAVVVSTTVPQLTGLIGNRNVNEVL
jgi:hypothetical protein